ncbi:Gfo/Idh/MocA family oxidoreductase [bacterium]|nr:Gfo/Idh/MocA family oxidoreductase [bacterium]MBU1650953.1 Gfo/Idh/MocA family oxidoreductase [bacterium]MBU1881335.1 Gfo/Idh/MocA family oxidoreductase [bacterium]
MSTVKQKKIVKLGVIGTGAIAQMMHFPNLRKFENVQIEAVCDLELAKAGSIAKKYHIPRFFQDPQRLLAIEEIDGVLILTPTNSHLALTLSAFDHGKHVFVERPIARNVAEAEKMVEASKRANRLLMVAMNHRFRPDSMILKNFIEGGELGNIFMVRTGWLKKKGRWSGAEWHFDKKLSGGGVMMDLGLQMLDLSLWLIDQYDVKRISAQLFNDMLGLEVEDTVSCQLLMRDGKTVTLHASWALLAPETQAYAHFWGTQGAAVLNPLRIDKEMHGNLVNVTPEKSITQKALYLTSFEYELRHFVECIRNGNQPISCGDDALKILRIVEAIYKAAARGKNAPKE